jgi:hypothetical protein
MSVANRSVWMVAVLLVGVWTFHPDVRSAAGQPSTTKSIVVAELFTSEGCSSCPPADAVMSQLVLRQPVVDERVHARRSGTEPGDSSNHQLLQERESHRIVGAGSASVNSHVGTR